MGTNAGTISGSARRHTVMACLSRTVTLSLALALLSLSLVLAVPPAHAVAPDEVLKDRGLEARARALSQNLRCLVCRNQSIDDSDAPLARDLRVLVRERLTLGETDAQAMDFIVARYGTFVLLRPPVQGNTLLLWLAPLGLLLAAVLGFRRLFAGAAAPAVVTADAVLTPDEAKRVEVLLGDHPQR